MNGVLASHSPPHFSSNWQEVDVNGWVPKSCHANSRVCSEILKSIFEEISLQLFFIEPSQKFVALSSSRCSRAQHREKKTLNFFKEKRRKDKNDVFPSKISKKIFQKGWLTFYNQIESRWHILDICRPQSTLLRTERPYFGPKIVSLAFWGLWALGAFGLFGKVELQNRPKAAFIVSLLGAENSFKQCWLLFALIHFARPRWRRHTPSHTHTRTCRLTYSHTPSHRESGNCEWRPQTEVSRTPLWLCLILILFLSLSLSLSLSFLKPWRKTKNVFLVCRVDYGLWVPGGSEWAVRSDYDGWTEGERWYHTQSHCIPADRGTNMLI